MTKLITPKNDNLLNMRIIALYFIISLSISAMAFTNVPRNHAIEKTEEYYHKATLADKTTAEDDINEQSPKRSLFDMLFGIDKQEDPAQNTQESLMYDSQEDGSFFGAAVIKALDKTLGSTITATVMLKKKQDIKDISIKVMACWKPNMKYIHSKARALIEVHQNYANEPTKRLFYGWMFADLPSLTPMLNSQYSIMVIDCIDEISEYNEEATTANVAKPHIKSKKSK